MSFLIFVLAILSVFTGASVILWGAPKVYLRPPEGRSTNYISIRDKGDKLKFVQKYGHLVYYDEQAISLADAEKALNQKIRYGALWAISFLLGGLGALYSGVHLIRSIVSGN